MHSVVVEGADGSVLLQDASPQGLRAIGFDVTPELVSKMLIVALGYEPRIALQVDQHGQSVKLTIQCGAWQAPPPEWAELAFMQRPTLWPWPHEKCALIRREPGKSLLEAEFAYLRWDGSSLYRHGGLIMFAPVSAGVRVSAEDLAVMYRAGWRVD
jgi:hypothetical protein